MATFSVELSSAERKALLHTFESVENAQAWIDNAIHNEARRCIDRIIYEYTDVRVDKKTVAEKAAIIDGLTLE